MIAFTCPHCAQKFQVRPECAGRSACCPVCKQPLAVPTPASTDVAATLDHIEGAPSSIVRAGLEGGITLEQTEDASPTGQPSVQDLLARRSGEGQRYLLEGEIARGGMGAVMRAVDCDLRREVAVKFMLDQADPKKKQRFVEEAQITGQLEHPNIVPIHELGLDAQKRLFFAMKMVKGRSLAEVLNIHRDEPRKAEKDWSLGRLLGIFVNICHALAYAHSRGVIHRDLKPANIMVGDFGEVYVMDWGLAKVLHGGGQQAEETLVSTGQQGSANSTSKVVTDRGAEANLTQEGSILGTPMYMPPEQAAGEIQAIDQRSDVYSLGAILYEMLTLEPPVDPEGGPMGVLMQVLQGQIMLPEQRTPARAKAGRIPRELSAIAMKALAKEPKDRYASVEDLRRDIERFQEGRSVSAKEDTKWEMIWKFVKRNKGFSAGAAAALLVLLTSVVVLYQAWQGTLAAESRTATAYADLKKEQAEKDKKQAEKEQLEKDKRDLLVRSVPTLLDSARYFSNQRKFATASDQVRTALEYDPTSADAHLLKAQLLLGEKKFDAARVELTECLRLRPQHPGGRAISAVLQKGKPEHMWMLFVELSEELTLQQLPGLAAVVLESAGDLLAARKKLVPLYRHKIEEAWPGLGERLRIDDKGRIHLDVTGCKQVVDLKPLQGMQLTTLSLHDCFEVRDLTPLKGMPLTELSLAACNKVSDLTPLQDMPLTSLDLLQCHKVVDLAPLKGMKLTYLKLAVCAGVQDLTPLKGMPLKWLSLDECGLVRDLTPLKGMPLKWLSLHLSGQVRDLTPLKGMDLKTLLVCYTAVQDLTPLENMDLEDIRLTPKNITKGLSLLRQMKSLQAIGISWEGDQKWPAAEFWRKYDGGEFK